MNKFFKTIFGLFCLSFLLGIPTSFAAGEQLEVHVHKNTLDGEEWTSANFPIKVELKKADGSGIGIGNMAAILDAAKGVLTSGTERTCSFSWTDASGVPVNREVILPAFTQLPAGEFLIPPFRTSQEKLLLKSTTLTNCGGGEAEYQNLNQELAALPANPFFRTTDFLSLAAEEFLGEEVTISIAHGDLVATTTATPLSGYACRVPANGDQPEKRGLCEQTLRLDPAAAQNGIFRVDLVIVESGIGAPDIAPIEEPLVQGANAEFSSPVTAVGNFLIRTSALLDWTLAIDETGLRNEKITLLHQKALDIVNGFFILALLTIALLWNFSLLISRERLKKMVVLFVIGVVSVNFALPITRLAVDGTNLLQQTLLVTETNSSLAPGIPDDSAPVGVPGSRRISASDIFSAAGLNISAFVGLQKTAYVEKTYPQELGAPIETNKLTEKSDLYVDRFQENTWFNLVLIGLGAIGQLLIALILLFRYIIIWFLLILSPFLLLFAIFESTRSLLRSWGWLYVRWLFIGPIMALALFVVVNIWSLGGVPLESSYATPGNLYFPNTTNLYVSAPGISSGYLNTPREVMKYIAALMMLFLTVLLPFWLTRAIPSGLSAFATGTSGKKTSGMFAKFFGQKTLETKSEVMTSSPPEQKIEQNVEVRNAPNGITEMRESNKILAASEKFAAPDSKDLSRISSRNLANTLQILEMTPKKLSSEAATKKREAVLKELTERAAQGDPVARERLAQEKTSSARTVQVTANQSSVKTAETTSKETPSESMVPGTESSSASQSSQEIKSVVAAATPKSGEILKSESTVATFSESRPQRTIAELSGASSKTPELKDLLADQEPEINLSSGEEIREISEEEKKSESEPGEL